MKRWSALWATALVFYGAYAPALTDLKPTLSATDFGTVWFASAGTLVRSADGSLTTGDPVVLSGDLGFPPGAGPFPAVILAHGCSGILPGKEAAWASVLREWGYATFVVDSFSGRNLIEACTNARALTGTQRVPDAYGALRILVTHPKIDPRRVALMGFSHGGLLTMLK